jgi:hypothetical protein
MGFLHFARDGTVAELDAARGQTAPQKHETGDMVENAMPTARNWFHRRPLIGVAGIRPTTEGTPLSKPA